MSLVRAVFLATTMLTTSATLAKADVNVVTSIKPVHSLVAAVMQGVGTPDLLVEGAASPHTYALKPSQAGQLQNADLVFWMSHDLEAFLEKSIESIASGATSVPLMESHGLIKLNFREGGAFDSHDHDDHGHGDHAFEWAGVFDLPAGTYKWSFAKVDGDYADPAMKMVILESDDIEASEELAEELLESKDSRAKSHNDALVVSNKAYTLGFDETKEATVFMVDIEKDGKFAFFTEHMPLEFEANEHFFKDGSGNDVEPIAQEPDMGHHDDHADHGGHDDHDDHADSEEHDDHDDHGHGGVDPHVWLDPVNAKALVHEIEEALAEADPANAATYGSNAEAVMSRLDDLVAEIDAELEPVKDRRYVVFHDAYQYFEKRFGVSAVGSITVSPEVLPGAERVSALQEKVRGLNATCVFSEPQFEPKLVATITENSNAGTGVLDPLGAAINDGPNLYFTLIRNMAKSLKDCLMKSG